MAIIGDWGPQLPPAPAPSSTGTTPPPVNPTTGTVDYTGWGASSPTGATKIDPNVGQNGDIPADAQDLGGGNYWSPSQGQFNVQPPTQSAQPPAGGGASGFGNASDFLNWDPAYQQALAMEQQGFGQLDAQLKAQRERAIINFGDRALASQAGFGLDPQAAAFAQQNYLSGNSTMSRLDRAHQLAAQAVINQLAAHGLLNSGDLGYKEGVENQGYGNNVYDARQSVLDALAGLYNNYLGGRQSYEQMVNNAMSNALNAWLQNPDLYSPSTPTSQPNSNPNPNPPPGSNPPPKTVGRTSPSFPVGGVGARGRAGANTGPGTRPMRAPIRVPSIGRTF